MEFKATLKPFCQLAVWVKIIFFNKNQNLIVLQNVDNKQLDLLSKHHGFNYFNGGFNFITDQRISNDLAYINLQFNYFEEKDIEKYEELNMPYNIIMNFFNNLDFSKIETNVEIGKRYIEKQNKFLENLFRQVGFSDLL